MKDEKHWAEELQPLLQKIEAETKTPPTPESYEQGLEIATMPWSPNYGEAIERIARSLPNINEFLDLLNRLGGFVRAIGKKQTTLTM